MPNNTDNPHDRYFKETFSQVDILADFLNVYLPDALRNQLDFSSLEREFDTYTDETLSEHFADLVFTARLNDRSVRLAVLLEHKSYTEPYIHFQLNRYMLTVWDAQLSEKKPLLPIIRWFTTAGGAGRNVTCGPISSRCPKPLLLTYLALIMY